MRKKVLKIYMWVIAIGLGIYAFIATTGITLDCFYYKNFGLKCPGCGVTRMFLSMFKLDFTSAFWYNPVLFATFFVWNIIGVLCIWDKIEFVKNPKFLYTVFWVNLSILVVFGILRNFI